ncbi:glycosyl hydrolase family 28-related protein [Sphingobacterium yanglingense]|nr:glycosyl hydrolase family 28-related protein [Sphingobacterium yanglingense]
MKNNQGFNIKKWLILIGFFLHINVQANVQEVIINVKEVGAKGNGISDDTRAIQNILNSFDEKGGTVFFPEGTYLLSNKLVVKSNNIIIKGDVNCILSFSTKNCSKELKGDGNCDLGIHVSPNLKNITIVNLNIKSNTTDQMVAYGINVRDFVENIVISNCILDGFTGGILFNRLNKNIKCDDNIFRNMTFVPKAKAGGYGIVYQSSSNTSTTGNVFENTIYRHALYYARNPKYSESGQDHVFENNTVYGSVQNEYLTGYELSFKILGNSNFRIENNSFIGGVGHIWMTRYKTGADQNCNNIVIKSNTFKSIINRPKSKVYAIGSDDQANSYNLRIENNTFTDNDVDYLIKIQEATKVFIVNNVAKNIIKGDFLYVEGGAHDLNIIGNNINGINTNYSAFVIGEQGNKKFSSDILMRNNDIKSQGNGIVANNLVKGDINDNNFYVDNIGIVFSGMNYEGVISNNRFFKSKQVISVKSNNVSQNARGNYFNGKIIK